MMGGPAYPDTDKAIIADEIGIETGLYHDYRLKTAYQPIFRREGSRLCPFAVEGLAMPYLFGMRVPSFGFFGGMPPEDRSSVEGLCRVLHLRNYHNIGAPGLQLFLNCDPGADAERSIRDIRALAATMREIGLDPRLLTCGIAETQAVDGGAVAMLAGEVRRQRIRVALDDFGAGYSTVECVTRIGPEIVTISGAWFRLLQGNVETARLFPSVVAGFQGLGAKVLVKGIETAGELRMALDAGAEYLQGSLLAGPALAGTIFDEKPRPVDALLREEQKVVRLFG